MNWMLLYEIVYPLVVVLVCIRIIYETQHQAKTLAYLLLVIFFPLVGIFIYFSFGINYRKRKIYSKKLTEDVSLSDKLNQDMLRHSRLTFEQNKALLDTNRELSYMLAKNDGSMLTAHNEVKLLVNGENKFPDM